MQTVVLCSFVAFFLFFLSVFCVPLDPVLLSFSALPVPPVPVPVSAFPVPSAPAPAALPQPAMFNRIQYNNLFSNLVQLLAAVPPAPLPPQCGGHYVCPISAPASAPAPVLQSAIFNGIQYNNLPENLAHLLAAVLPAPLPLQQGGHNVHSQPFPVCVLSLCDFEHDINEEIDTFFCASCTPSASTSKCPTPFTCYPKAL
ncbi:hypothetical protein CVT25_011985 [Psilocybe cyanescens]|uniref:Uncharacterized protein n=1 Tax=Psilocybe cyanescens TaxID=93625 RepID=A0A409XFD7_PSICY|nr:hypothetical protein CVT25_011985 [Psilocybe cyanescens]